MLPYSMLGTEVSIYHSVYAVDGRMREIVNKLRKSELYVLTGVHGTFFFFIPLNWVRFFPTVSRSREVLIEAIEDSSDTRVSPYHSHLIYHSHMMVM